MTIRLPTRPWIRAIRRAVDDAWQFAADPGVPASGLLAKLRLTPLSTTMTPTAVATCEWAGYLNDSFDFAQFEPGSRILDVGFGEGQQLRRLRARGCHGIGLDPDGELVSRARSSGLPVCRAQAEALPFPDGGFDGVVCKVVVPYTDEARAIAEIARVLKRGGTARVSYHGLGYFLRYLCSDRNWKRRFYGVRTLANTWWYATTGRRLPGFLGDTLYQSDTRLAAYYARTGLELLDASRSPTFLGAPVFIYHVVRRTEA